MPRQRFKAEFIRRMHIPTAWPTNFNAEQAIRKQINVFSKDSYGRLKRGLDVDERYIAAYLAAVSRAPAEPSGYDEFLMPRRLLREFLVGQGESRELSKIPVDEIRRLVCDAPAENNADTKRFPDYLRTTMSAIGDLINFEDRLAGRFVAACRDVEAIRIAVRWMHVDEGRLIAGDADLPADRAAELSEARMGASMGKITDAFLNWDRLSKWITVVMRGDRRHVDAMSTVIPLSEEAFANIRAGRQAPHDISGDGLRMGSRYLMVYAAAHRPADDGGSGKDATLGLLACILLQIAALSQSQLLHADETICLIAPAGFPLGKKRLKGAGFHPTGRYIPGSAHEIMALEIPPKTKPRKTLFLRTLIDSLSASIDSAPENDWSPVDRT